MKNLKCSGSGTIMKNLKCSGTLTASNISLNSVTSDSNLNLNCGNNMSGGNYTTSYSIYTYNTLSANNILPIIRTGTWTNQINGNSGSLTGYNTNVSTDYPWAYIPFYPPLPSNSSSQSNYVVITGPVIDSTSNNALIPSQSYPYSNDTFLLWLNVPSIAHLPCTLCFTYIILCYPSLSYSLFPIGTNQAETSIRPTILPKTGPVYTSGGYTSGFSY